MIERKLYCVNDPGHADFHWSSQSEFMHVRKYDCNGAVIRDWTFPTSESYEGELRCAVCGGEVFVAGKTPSDMGDKVMACDFLGRCRSFFQDENMNNLEKLLENLAAAGQDRHVQRLVGAIGDDPACRELLGKYGLLEASE